MVRGRRFSKNFARRADAERWCERRLDDNTVSEEGRLLSLVPRQILKAVEATDFNRDEILEGAIPVGTVSGIYFLIDGDEVCYVGQSRNVFHRLAQHTRNGFKFTAYNFIPCPVEQLDELERQYLLAIWPNMNRRFDQRS